MRFILYSRHNTVVSHLNYSRREGSSHTLLRLSHRAGISVISLRSVFSLTVVNVAFVLQDIDFFQHLEMHLRAEQPSLCGRDHISYRSYYLPVKVRF